MRAFFDFVIKNKYFNEKLVINYIIDYEGNKPVILDIVKKNNLLSKKKIITAILYMSNNNVNFKTAIKKLGLYSEKIEKKIKQEYESYTYNFLKKIIKESQINFGSANDSIFDFFESLDIPTDELAIMPLYFGKIRTTYVKRYCQLFDEDYKEELEKIIRSYSILFAKNKIILKEQMRECYRHFHSIKSISNEINIHLSERLCSLAEKIFLTLEKNIAKLNIEKTIEAQENQVIILKYLWGINQNLKNEKSEEEYWNRNKIEIINLCKKTKVLINEIEELSV